MLQNKADDTIIRYSHQFNQASSEQRSPTKEQDLYSQAEILNDVNTSQVSVEHNPMLEPSRKEVAVGDSVYQSIDHPQPVKKDA